MPFPEKLTEIMQIRNIFAQDISKLSRKNITVSDIRSFQNGNSLPTLYQIKILNHLLGIDFDLFINPSPKNQLQTRQLGISISEFGEVKKIDKPGDQIKSAKIKNSITRFHDIPKPDKDQLICGHCFQIDDSCRYNHPEDSEIKFMFGGPGTGEKNPDEICALLCSKCTLILDEKPDKNANREEKLEHALLWAKSIIFTQTIRIAELEKKQK